MNQSRVPSVLVAEQVSHHPNAVHTPRFRNSSSINFPQFFNVLLTASFYYSTVVATSTDKDKSIASEVMVAAICLITTLRVIAIFQNCKKKKFGFKALLDVLMGSRFLVKEIDSAVFHANLRKFPLGIQIWQPVTLLDISDSILHSFGLYCGIIGASEAKSEISYLSVGFYSTIFLAACCFAAEFISSHKSEVPFGLVARAGSFAVLSLLLPLILEAQSLWYTSDNVLPMFRFVLIGNTLFYSLALSLRRRSMKSFSHFLVAHPDHSVKTEFRFWPLVISLILFLIVDLLAVIMIETRDSEDTLENDMVLHANIACSLSLLVLVVKHNCF